MARAELEVLLDLLFEVDAVWDEAPMTRDNALLVLTAFPSLRNTWLRRALDSGHPRAREVIDAWVLTSPIATVDREEHGADWPR